MHAHTLKLHTGTLHTRLLSVSPIRGFLLLMFLLVLLLSVVGVGDVNHQVSSVRVRVGIVQQCDAQDTDHSCSYPFTSLQSPSCGEVEVYIE